MITQNDDEEDDYISRSHFKREAEAAQALGERLITLRKEQLDQLDLSEKLYDSILLAQRLTANGAIRRQRQFIGKLMRTEILEPIEAKLAEWDRGGKAETARLHRLERWRDRLLAMKRHAERVDDRIPQHRCAAGAQPDPQCAQGKRAEQATQKQPRIVQGAAGDGGTSGVRASVVFGIFPDTQHREHVFRGMGFAPRNFFGFGDDFGDVGAQERVGVKLAPQFKRHGGVA